MSTNFKILFLQVALIKIIISLFVAVGLSYFEFVNVFEFGDFNGYKNPQTNSDAIISRNFLYSDLIHLVGANSISHPIFLIVAVVGAILVDWLCIIIFVNLSETKGPILFAYLIFCFHPYFSIYTFRLTTDFFAKLACVIFITYVFAPKRMSRLITCLLIIFMAMFRIYSLVFLIGLAIDKFKVMAKGKQYLRILFIAFLFSSIFIFVLYLNWSYLREVFVFSKFYGLSQFYTIKIFGDYGEVINFVLHYFYRLFVLLGGREALFTDGIEVFLGSFEGRVQLISFGFLALFHIFCLLCFLRLCISRQVFLEIIFPLSALMFALLSVGHMRYLLSYYPMILIGWFYLTTRFNNASLR